ncbi:MAG TPA: 50S ribosomal protein L16 [Caldisericia bacterium]|nr:50S ribosomal protein L16 [Caldisericia bacterium]HPF49287.1 50S ribosomal protein L16 [Caldisericia bacterium]HPI84033.1 50S ribosomal protein L16 [Caldisericia bacterium]HPQ93291.1 50S ribosomal protein L16 [Caldisericia bacterium]HRV75327.1 50S ribosomal protein L16 [Caldisericia bacterium]
MLQPERTKYRKQQRGRMRGRSKGGNVLNYGDFGIQALEPHWISARQIEAVRLVITGRVPKTGKIWIRIFPDKPISKKPLETRMGKGKADTDYWVAVVKPGKVMVEFTGCSEEIAREAARIAGSKLPMKTRFTSRRLESQVAL